MFNPNNVAFKLFGKSIYWYGILMAIAIILAVVLCYREAKRKKISENDLLNLCLIVIPCGIVGARLYYVLFNLDVYLSNPVSMLYIWEGGLAIYGAVIFGLVGAFIYTRAKKIRFLRVADMIAPGLVLAQAIGRWGNFFNQEAFGLPVSNPELLWFPMTVRIDGLHYFDGVLCDNPYHLATFFYESIWCLLVFIFLWSMRKRFKHDGDAILWYALLYGLERAFVEQLRGDSLWLVPGTIRVSQLVSAIMVVAVLVFFIVRAIKEKKEGRLMWPKPLAVDGAPVNAATFETAAATEDAPEEKTDVTVKEQEPKEQKENDDA